VQCAGQKWEYFSEYVIIESSRTVVMKEFEIKDLPNAPETREERYIE